MSKSDQAGCAARPAHGGGAVLTIITEDTATSVSSAGSVNSVVDRSTEVVVVTEHGEDDIADRG